MGITIGITKRHTCVLTGSGIEYGGSHVRKEATGLWPYYILEEALRARGEVLEGKKIIVSGSGNVAIYAAEKLYNLEQKLLPCLTQEVTFMMRMEYPSHL